MDKRGEQLREIMYKKINKYGHESKEALLASQALDRYMNKHCFNKNN